jgi:phosphomannomutase
MDFDQVAAKNAILFITDWSFIRSGNEASVVVGRDRFSNSGMLAAWALRGFLRIVSEIAVFTA